MTAQPWRQNDRWTRWNTAERQRRRAQPRPTPVPLSIPWLERALAPCGITEYMMTLALNARAFCEQPPPPPVDSQRQQAADLQYFKSQMAFEKDRADTLHDKNKALLAELLKVTPAAEECPSCAALRERAEKAEAEAARLKKQAAITDCRFRELTKQLPNNPNPELLVPLSAVRASQERADRSAEHDGEAKESVQQG